MGSIRLWDTSTTWNDLEPSKGVYKWSNLDGYLALAQAHDVDVLYTFGGTANWAAISPGTNCGYGPGSCFPPSNIQDWDDFVTAVVAHTAGKIKYWELWNEPNLSIYWAGDVPTLVTMAQHAYKIIKTAQPTAIILSPAVTGVGGGRYLNTYLSAGGLGYLDVIAFHGYPGWSTYADPEGIVIILSGVQTAMSSNHISSTPIWDTEGGWGLDKTISNNTQGAGYLAREYLVQWSNGVSRFFWYQWNNTDIGTLWTSSSGIQPAGFAYGQLYNWIVGATINGPCNMASDSTWSCLLTRPGGYRALAVWNSARTTSYTPASQYTQYLDLAGHTNPVNGSVTIGYNPILLESSASPAPPINIRVTAQ
jgi:hypothetical protein